MINYILFILEVQKHYFIVYKSRIQKVLDRSYVLIMGSLINIELTA